MCCPGPAGPRVCTRLPATWYAHRRGGGAGTRTSCASIPVFPQDKSNNPKVSTNCSCDLQVFPVNGLKCISRHIGIYLCINTSEKPARESVIALWPHLRGFSKLRHFLYGFFFFIAIFRPRIILGVMETQLLTVVGYLLCRFVASWCLSDFFFRPPVYGRDDVYGPLGSQDRSEGGGEVGLREADEGVLEWSSLTHPPAQCCWCLEPGTTLCASVCLRTVLVR